MASVKTDGEFCSAVRNTEDRVALRAARVTQTRHGAQDCESAPGALLTMQVKRCKDYTLNWQAR